MNHDEEQHSNWWAKFFFDFADASLVVRNGKVGRANELELDIITVKWSKAVNPFESDPIIGCVEAKLANRNSYEQAASLMAQLNKRYRLRTFNQITGLMDAATGVDWTAFPKWAGFIEATRGTKEESPTATVRRTPENLFVSYGEQRYRLLGMIRQFYYTAAIIGGKILFAKCQLPSCNAYYGFGWGESPPFEADFAARHSRYCPESKEKGNTYAYHTSEIQNGGRVYCPRREFRWLN